MDWLWDWLFWTAVECALLLVAVVANLRLRLWERTEAKARTLSSEKARVGLRTLLYTSVAAAGMLIFGIKSIVQSKELVTSSLIALLLLLLGSFVVATLKTAGESYPDKETS